MTFFALHQSSVSIAAGCYCKVILRKKVYAQYLPTPKIQGATKLKIIQNFY